MRRGAAPVFMMRSGFVSVWPITTVLKSKLAAESDRTGKVSEEWGVAPTQPNRVDATAKSQAARARRRVIGSDVDCCAAPNKIPPRNYKVQITSWLNVQAIGPQYSSGTGAPLVVPAPMDRVILWLEEVWTKIQEEGEKWLRDTNRALRNKVATETEGAFGGAPCPDRLQIDSNRWQNRNMENSEDVFR